MTQPISAIIFDMDGILLDSEPMSFRSWQKAMANVGHEYTIEHFLAVVGSNSEQTHKVLQEQFGIDQAACLHIRADRERILHTDIMENAIPLKPGVAEILRELQHIPMAVATSTSRALAEVKLEKAGIRDAFQLLVCGDEVKHSKPDPEIYLAAAAAINTPAKQCVALEDSHAGIQSAHRAGMTTILIPDLQPMQDDIAQYVTHHLPSMSDALPLMHSFFTR